MRFPVGKSGSSIVAFKSKAEEPHQKGTSGWSAQLSGYATALCKAQFHGHGDTNEVNPVLGPLQSNGRPTVTIVHLWKSSD